MTTLYHTPIVTGQPVNVSVVNTPMSQLDAAIASMVSGGLGFTKLNLGTETEVTIASGAITVSKNRHRVDTESDAATDDVTDILGGTAGQILFLRAEDDARVPTFKHNAAKIFLSSRQDVALDNELMGLTLLCVDGTIWMQIDPALALSVSANNGFTYFRDVDVVPKLMARNRIWQKAAAATVAAVGFVATNNSGTLSASNDTDSTYINMQAAAAGGAIAGGDTFSFNLFRRQHNPKLQVLVRTGAAGDIANIRIWIGMCSAVPTNVDSLVGVASFAGFRYSTVAGDGGFVPVCCDNAVQNVGSPIVAVAASTRYLFEVELNDALGIATFRINGGTPVTLNANLPAAATELGLSFRLITTVATLKNWKFGRLVAEFD